MTVVFHHELKDELRGLVFCSTTVPFAHVSQFDLNKKLEIIQVAK